MNPASIARYHTDLTGRNLKACHTADSNEKIDCVIAWFKESRDNNIIYISRNDKENKDVYMVALRDNSGTLIGYYEKHEYRNRETAEFISKAREVYCKKQQPQMFPQQLEMSITKSFTEYKKLNIK